MAFSIKELEQLSGIKAHTIRIWEHRYHFLKPSRTDTNIRSYSVEELKTLLTVALLNKYGIKISRIDEMQPEQWHHALLQQVEAQDEYLVNQLVGHMVDMDHVAFEEVLNLYIHQKGLEETVVSLIFGFLQKVGILWQTNHINAAQEHIAAHIIRQKIISAIDNLPAVFRIQPLFLLFLPEDEHHELGLLYVYYLLKKRGLPVLYLGASAPLDDVAYVMRIKQPSYLYLHLASFPPGGQFEKYIHRLSTIEPHIQILISGSVVSGYKKVVPHNVTLLHSLEEAIDLIKSV
ncbi:MerR family transcriptional regulator [Chitinophagaceae bacterium LB-8]|uniref:MerR family transcriptional regulator n=1 Tax=Paraflavisolibacter caeni TaxID=2982496 RepID=A0A9X2XXH6_9BACT|nr:MerR family transcriptional regulator [Paraflavisolibacter caeni]MCU7551314.1 MerR family transcriptional regulator [Paraflavisolibacter caeni]